VAAILKACQSSGGTINAANAAACLNAAR
jgi:hypothetical protein